MNLLINKENLEYDNKDLVVLSKIDEIIEKINVLERSLMKNHNKNLTSGFTDDYYRRYNPKIMVT